MITLYDDDDKTNLMLFLQLSQLLLSPPVRLLGHLKHRGEDGEDGEDDDNGGDDDDDDDNLDSPAALRLSSQWLHRSR